MVYTFYVKKHREIIFCLTHNKLFIINKETVIKTTTTNEII